MARIQGNGQGLAFFLSAPKAAVQHAGVVPAEAAVPGSIGWQTNEVLPHYETPTRTVIPGQQRVIFTFSTRMGSAPGAV